MDLRDFSTPLPMGVEEIEIFMLQVLEHLGKQRKVALRMGELSIGSPSFVLKEEVLKPILAKTKDIDSLTEYDFRPNITQKGVDMRIGLDVASLAQGRYVDQIILIAGDSDFLPAVKMARKHGIDFILDSMKQYPKKTMQLHVDGIECYVNQLYTKCSSPDEVQEGEA
jgi:uncharacterized protein (TIGR00288 family)